MNFFDKKLFNYILSCVECTLDQLANDFHVSRLSLCQLLKKCHFPRYWLYLQTVVRDTEINNTLKDLQKAVYNLQREFIVKNSQSSEKTPFINYLESDEDIIISGNTFCLKYESADFHRDLVQLFFAEAEDNLNALYGGMIFQAILETESKYLKIEQVYMCIVFHECFSSQEEMQEKAYEVFMQKEHHRKNSHLKEIKVQVCWFDKDYVLHETDFVRKVKFL